MADPTADEQDLSPGAGEAAAALEAGRLLFARECSFVAAATEVGNLPEAKLPEIAFAGRSNVGKSSLLNALVGHKALARVSNTPGRTQQVNFFDLGGRLMLVDLPGYGYAKAPQSSVAGWTRLIEGYLRGRAPLKRAMLLIDARHGLKDSDRAAMKMMDASAVTYQLVLTKIDLVKGAALEAVRQAVAEEARRHPAAHPDIMCVSAERGAGVPELRAVLAALAQPAGEKTR